MRQTILLVFLLPAIFISACRGRAPYEGKSVAELERMLRDPNPTVQAQGAYGLSRLGSEARSAVPSLIEALKKTARQGRPALAVLAVSGQCSSEDASAGAGTASDPGTNRGPGLCCSNR